MRAPTAFRPAVGLSGRLPPPPPAPPHHHQHHHHHHHHLCHRHRHAPVCVRSSSCAASPPREEKVVEVESAGERSYWSRRIRALCSAADPDEALRLLDCLRLRGYRPDGPDLAAVLRALCSLGRSAEAHRRLLLHLHLHLRHAPSAYVSLLLAPLLDARTPLLTLRLLRRLPRALLPSLSVYNRLIHLLCSLPLPRPLPLHAHRLLLEMRSRGRPPDAVSYTALLDGYARLGDADAARRLLDEMPSAGVAPNSLTRSVLVKALLRARRLEEARQLMLRLWPAMEHHKQQRPGGGEEHPSAAAAAFANLVGCLCREGLFREVFRIAEDMPQGRSVAEEFAYGQMIDSLCRAGRHHGASRIVYIMRKRGLAPSSVSYNCIVHGLSKRRRGGCMRAYQLLKEGAEFGYFPPEPTYKALVEGLCREKDLVKAKDVLELVLRRSDGDADRTRIYNIFLAALRMVDNPSEQLNVVVTMLRKQCRPDVITLNTLVHGFCKLGRVGEAKKIMSDMLEGTFCAPDVVTFTTLVRGLFDVAEAEEALHLLHRVMPKHRCAPNTVTYNVVIRGLFNLQKADKAMDVFNEMLSEGVAADCATHTAIVEGLCERGRIEEVKKFWDDVVWPSKIHDDYVYAAICRGLCRLGKLDRACDFLYELVDCGVSPGIVSYNILIDSACKMRSKKEAYQIVHEMRKNGLKPDAVTWRILDKLHEEESMQHIIRDESSESIANIEERVMPIEFEDKISPLRQEASERDNVGVGSHDDSLEGLVDLSLSTVSIEEDEIDLGRPVTIETNLTEEVKEKPCKHEEREPLSRIARRVFGLL
ncbi:Pentatricopeptide repeat-containing protein [Ananas comosus]|uniref:Pentatricopeptide repeat-containing protein n=1 Tax=Ananas comosus TaxID=4615 RepID=A0A199UVS7_ANACO|nr:Pentatricopeptide repeat-containing protein [Ananas comosus]